MCGRVFGISFQSSLESRTQVSEFFASEGGRPHYPPCHPLHGAILLIGHHIDCDAPPEVHLVCTENPLSGLQQLQPQSVHTVSDDAVCTNVTERVQQSCQCF